MDLEIIEIDLAENEDGSVDIHDIQKHLDCRFFDAVRINDKGDAIYVDDEGLCREGMKGVFKASEWYPDPLMGCGIVLGCDCSGESQPPTVTLEEVKQNVDMGIAVPNDDISTSLFLTMMSATTK
jgi:hypothetical protein